MISREHLVADTAMLAGKIMLVSGADIYRVEDTMNRILKKSSGNATAFVLATGITLTVICKDTTITLTKRIGDRKTNLNHIYEVNSISRKLSSNEIDIEKAYESLVKIEQVEQYNSKLKGIGYIGVALFFAVLLGGDFMTCIATGIVGAALAIINYLITKIKLNDFCVNAVCSFGITVAAMLLKNFIKDINFDIIIISAIMPMVPGVTFTTAIRDTLNGDYTAGMARMLEAIVIALAVATGTGSAIALF